MHMREDWPRIGALMVRRCPTDAHTSCCSARAALVILFGGIQLDEERFAWQTQKTLVVVLVVVVSV